MRLVLNLLMLTFIGVSGLPIHDPASAVNSRALKSFKELTDKLNGLNLQMKRDSQPESAAAIQGAIQQMADKAQSLMDTVSLKRRVLKENLMSDNVRDSEDAFKKVFGVLASNKRELQNRLLLKKDQLLGQLGQNAKKIASMKARDFNNNLKRGLMLKRDQHMKGIDRIAESILGLKSLDVRNLKPSLMGKLKKDVGETQLAHFDWFPFKQEMLQKSERGLKQRDESENDHARLSSDFDWWFPMKQRSLQDSQKDIKSDRAVKEDLPDKSIAESVQEKAIRDVLGNIAWDWKKSTFYEPMSADSLN